MQEVIIGTNGKAGLGQKRPATAQESEDVVDLTIADQPAEPQSYPTVSERLELYQRTHRKLQRERPGERMTAIVGMMRRDLERLVKEAGR